MKWVIGGVVVIAALVAIVAAIGWMLPRDHVATATATVAAPQEVVWKVLDDPESYVAWRRDLKSVELLPVTPAGPSWREHSSDGRITYVAERREPPSLLVTRIADRDLPFGGSWEYRLAPDSADPGRTRVTITERGEVYNPIFRFLARYVMGHTATMDTYLASLRTRFPGS